jgi:negative regulator of flagellin synthesis FlgM
VKIGDNVKSINSGSVSESQSRPAKAGAAAKPAPPAGGQAKNGRVELSPLGAQLASIEASLANVPVVDTARVDEIKQAIADGHFKVNPEVVADRLLETVKDLIRAHQAAQ